MEIDNVKDCIEVKIHAGLVIENKTFELCMGLIAAYARNEGLKGLDIRFSDFGGGYWNILPGNLQVIYCRISNSNILIILIVVPP